MQSNICDKNELNMRKYMVIIKDGGKREECARLQN